MSRSNGDTTPIPVSTDDTTNRLVMRIAVERLQQDVTRHVEADEKVQGALLESMDKLNGYARSMRLILFLLGLSLGGIAFTGRWVVGHLVTDKLLEFHLIDYQRTVGGTGP